MSLTNGFFQTDDTVIEDIPEHIIDIIDPIQASDDDDEDEDIDDDFDDEDDDDEDED